MVARLVRDEEVVGSNPAYPTKGSLQVSTTPDGRLPVTTTQVESDPAKGFPEVPGVS